MAHSFAQEKMTPKANEWDKEEIFPVDVMREAGELGFGGIRVHEDYGGSGLSRVEQAIIFEALSSGCVSTAAYISIHKFGFLFLFML